MLVMPKPFQLLVVLPVTLLLACGGGGDSKPFVELKLETKTAEEGIYKLSAQVPAGWSARSRTPVEQMKWFMEFGVIGEWEGKTTGSSNSDVSLGLWQGKWPATAAQLKAKIYTLTEADAEQLKGDVELQEGSDTFAFATYGARGATEILRINVVHKGAADAPAIKCSATAWEAKMSENPEAVVQRVVEICKSVEIEGYAEMIAETRKEAAVAWKAELAKLATDNDAYTSAISFCDRTTKDLDPEGSVAKDCANVHELAWDALIAKLKERITARTLVTDEVPCDALKELSRLKLGRGMEAKEICAQAYLARDMIGALKAPDGPNPEDCYVRDGMSWPEVNALWEEFKARCKGE
jgi:hypothetical protein